MFPLVCAVLASIKTKYIQDLTVTTDESFKEGEHSVRCVLQPTILPGVKKFGKDSFSSDDNYSPTDIEDRFHVSRNIEGVFGGFRFRNLSFVPLSQIAHLLMVHHPMVAVTQIQLEQLVVLLVD